MSPHNVPPNSRERGVPAAPKLELTRRGARTLRHEQGEGGVAPEGMDVADGQNFGSAPPNIMRGLHPSYHNQDRPDHGEDGGRASSSDQPEPAVPPLNIPHRHINSVESWAVPRVSLPREIERRQDSTEQRPRSSSQHRPANRGLARLSPHSMVPPWELKTDLRSQ